MILTTAQNGTTQYVQARLMSPQPSWVTDTIAYTWQMPTNQLASQSSNLVLTPNVASGNAVSQADYLRVSVSAGQLKISRRSGGTVATLWSGPVTVGSALRQFELRMGATSLELWEGPIGSAALRVGGLSHGLAWSSGHVYLHGHNSSSLVPFAAIFDEFRILDLTP